MEGNTKESEERLWHPFALLAAGVVTVGALWFGAGYCLGYSTEPQTRPAIAGGVTGLGILLALAGIAAAIFVSGIATSPGYERRMRELERAERLRDAKEDGE